MARPVSPLFSGWNWQAETRPRSTEGKAVRAQSGDACRAGLQIIGMDKVAAGPRLYVAENAVVLLDGEGIPADMGDFQPHVAGEAAQTAGKDPQPPNPRAFLASLKEQLQTEADAEQGPVLGRPLPDGVGEAGGVQLFHGCAEGAHPREDKAVGLLEAGGGFSHAPADSQVGQGVLYTFQVARAVVNNTDQKLQPP